MEKVSAEDLAALQKLFDAAAQASQAYRLALADMRNKYGVPQGTALSKDGTWLSQHNVFHG